MLASATDCLLEESLQKLEASREKQRGTYSVRAENMQNVRPQENMSNLHPIGEVPSTL
jgi:hypothetical protein